MKYNYFVIVDFLIMFSISHCPTLPCGNYWKTQNDDLTICLMDDSSFDCYIDKLAQLMN